MSIWDLTYKLRKRIMRKGQTRSIVESLKIIGVDKNQQWETLKINIIRNLVKRGYI